MNKLFKSSFKVYEPQRKVHDTNDRLDMTKYILEAIEKENLLVSNKINNKSIQDRIDDVPIRIKKIPEYCFKFSNKLPEILTDSISYPEESDGADVSDAEEGDDYLESSISVDDYLAYIMDSVTLPRLENKKEGDLEALKNAKCQGVARAGTYCHMSKRHTTIEKLKRIQKSGGRGEQRVPFHQTDLRYKGNKLKLKDGNNAVIICIMDTSGSMGQTKKYYARSLYFLLYNYLKRNYDNVNVVFVAHTTTAKVVSEQHFFYRGESGGTYISSGYKKVLELLDTQYPTEYWNTYVYHCSDGDNWGEDNELATKLLGQICERCNWVGYTEIKTSSYTTSIASYYKELKYDNFTMAYIHNKKDIVLAFKQMLGAITKDVET